MPAAAVRLPKKCVAVCLARGSAADAASAGTLAARRRALGRELPATPSGAGERPYLRDNLNTHLELLLH
ncbi:hypothetical protein MTO96_042959 [Rhipicephalus appendiculatus]